MTMFLCLQTRKSPTERDRNGHSGIRFRRSLDLFTLQNCLSPMRQTKVNTLFSRASAKTDIQELIQAGEHFLCDDFTAFQGLDLRNCPTGDSHDQKHRRVLIDGSSTQTARHNPACDVMHRNMPMLLDFQTHGL